VSSLNSYYYKIENNLTYLVRTQQFVSKLEARTEESESTRERPSSVEHVEFDDVWFCYDGDEQVLRG